MQVVDAIVVGGGSTGAAVTYELARRGLRKVVLIDKLGLAAGATARSSAVIRTHYTYEPLARMAVFSLRVFSDFAERIGGNPGFERTGFLVIAGDDDLKTLKATVEMNRSLGIQTSMLGREELRDIEPRVTYQDVAIGAWEPESGRADPYGTTVAFAHAAQRLGAELKLGVPVRSLAVMNGRISGVATDEGTIAAGTVVVAAGYRTRDLVSQVGLDLPMTPVRHTMAVIHRSKAFGNTHPIVSDRVVANYYVPEGQELTLVGSNAAMGGEIDNQVEMDRPAGQQTLESLAERYLARFPGQDGATLRGGFTGIYDCSPDLQPILGRVPSIEGLHVATGFSGHGFKLCPAVGSALAEEICDGRSNLFDLEPFSPLRFEQKKPIRLKFSYSHPIESTGAPATTTHNHVKGSETGG